MDYSLAEIADALQTTDLALVCLDLEKMPVDAATLPLPDAEQAHAIVHEGARTLFIKRRIAARRILSVATKDTMTLAPLDWSSAGKPFLPHSHSRPICFSYSSSGNLFCLAVSRLGEVGCDIEEGNLCFSDGGLPASYLSTSECLRLEEIRNTSERSHAAHAAWVAKEAYLKQLGCGFLREPSSAEILVRWDSANQAWHCLPPITFFRVPQSAHAIGAMCTEFLTDKISEVMSIAPGTLFT